MKSEKRGFTLIELLVVIAIIGLLASIVLASLNSARRKSRDARRVADLKQLQNALELYANDSGGNYPSSASTQASPGQAASTALPAILVPNYIGAIPADPLAGSNNYQYRTNSNGTNNATNYCIGAYIESTVPSPADTCQTAVDLNGASQGVSNMNYSVGN